jgi:branched-chain amino acid aminotransferase
MTPLANERVCYFNGRIVPESQALVSFRDRGYIAGDGCFDTARTFGHKIFRLKEHVDRWYASQRYLGLDCGLPPAKVMAITEDVVRRNLHLIDADEDYWVSQRVSRGVNPNDVVAPTGLEPTVIVECQPLPLRARAALHRDGIDIVVPAVRRVGPDMLSPRAKTHNYLNLVMGDLQAKAVDPGAWAVLLDVNGNLAEGTGSNIFIVRSGRLKTPEARYVLPGVSRATVIELAATLGLAADEGPIDLYDAYTADECFITSTSLCICPARSINGRVFGDRRVPGPVTRRLMDAYVALIGFDFVGQYLRRLAA